MINAGFQSINEKFFININKLSNLLMENKFCEIEEMLYDESCVALSGVYQLVRARMIYITLHYITRWKIISYKMSLLDRFGSLILFLSFCGSVFDES